MWISLLTLIRAILMVTSHWNTSKDNRRRTGDRVLGKTFREFCIKGKQRNRAKCGKA